MKRLGCILTVLLMCVVVVGCRRGGSAPRKPLASTDERDLLPERREKSVVLQSRPKDRRAAVYIVNAREVEETILKDKPKSEHKAYWQKIATQQKDMEASKEGTTMVTKLQQQREQEQQDYETREFARACLDFLKNNKPDQYSEDNLARYLRREDRVCYRKYLDTVDSELVSDDVPLIKLHETKSMTFVPFVDMRDAAVAGAPRYVVCYASGGGGGGMMGQGTASFAVLNDGSIVPGAGIQQKIAEQELRILWVNFRDYSATLNRDKGEQPMHDKFIKYLREKAPPPLVSDIDNQVVYVHKRADGILDDLLGLQATRTVVMGNDNKDINMGHLTVFQSGVVRYTFPTFQFPPPKVKAGAGNMGLPM